MTGLVALLAAACSGVHTRAAAPAAERAAAHPEASARTSGSARTSQPTGSPGPVTLAFAGDVHFTGRTARLLHDPATAFGPITSVLKSADFTALNFETA